jgi:hypothetical protein
MSAITLDETMIKKLSTLLEATEICDSEGKVLGVYTPVEESLYNQQIPQHLLDKFDQAEIERRRKSTVRGKTTAEVLKRLEALEKAQ